jgi:hypothetical protein
MRINGIYRFDRASISITMTMITTLTMLTMLASVIAAASSASAVENSPADPLISDRPTFGASAEAVTPGQIQLEAGYTHERVEETTAHYIGELLGRFGVARNFELRLGLNSFIIEDLPGQDATNDFENIALGLKWKLVENRGVVPATALLITLDLPIGLEGIDNKPIEPAATAALGWGLSSVFSLGSNIGYRRLRGDNKSFNQWLGSLSLAAALSSRWNAFVEAFGFDRDDEAILDSVSFWNTGLTFLINANLQFDARYGRGMNGRGTDWFAGAGIVVRW